MKIVLATSNLGKVKEIKALLKDHEIYALSEILTPFEIVENGTSFKENALIKSTFFRLAIIAGFALKC